MALSGVLKSVEINCGGQCRWCMKNSRLSTSVWSITAVSNVQSTLGQYASYIVLTVDALQTNAALSRLRGSRVDHR